MTIKEALPEEEKAFYEQVEEMADQAFDDQCTGANPRYPLIRDLKELYVLAYRGCQVGATLYHQDGEFDAPNGNLETGEEPSLPALLTV